jgi:activating signal cointegrator 1
VTAAEGFPAITLWQPWASLVACGAKTWETRGWPTKYRGPLRIHAAARRPPVVWHHDVNRDAPPEVDLVAMGSCWEWTENVDDYTSGGRYDWVGPLGAVVATANLVDCVPITYDRHDFSHLPAEPGLYVEDYLSMEGRRLLWVMRLRSDGGLEPVEQIEGQRPFGIWEPGRWAWRLEDIAPTTDRCPACWGSGATGKARCGDVYHQCTGSCFVCPTCDGRLSCDPVPAKGGQRLWRWRP